MSLISDLRSEIHVLKAYHGDCIFIKSFDYKGHPFNILIDGGTAATFANTLRPLISKTSSIDLVVLTHIDSDHISGLIKLFQSSLFTNLRPKHFWINAPNLIQTSSGDKISYKQGVSLEKLLLSSGIARDQIIEVHNEVIPQLPTGITAEFFSPTKEILRSLYDRWPELNTIPAPPKSVKISSSVTSQIQKGKLEDIAIRPFAPQRSISSDIINSSSISFSLTLPDTSILLLGDSRPEIIMESLTQKGYTNQNKLRVNYVKVSHHGSANNTSCEMLDMIDCDKYLISTNGGNSDHQHPDRETIARIIHHPNRDKTSKRIIFFNYSLKEIEKRAGKFIQESDLLTGNWTFAENITSL